MNENNEEDPNQRFVQLLSQNDLALRRYVRMLMADAEAADDVYQETLLECWKKFPVFNQQRHETSSGDSEGDSKEPANRDGFLKWARAIARFKVLRRRRDFARDRLQFQESVVEQLTVGAIERADLFKEHLLAVEHCLSELDETSRQLLLSIYRPGESVAAIAKNKGESVRRMYSKVDALRRLIITCVERKLRGGY